MTFHETKPLKFMETKANAAERDRTAIDSIRQVLNEEQPKPVRKKAAVEPVSPRITDSLKDTSPTMPLRQRERKSDRLIPLPPQEPVQKKAKRGAGLVTVLKNRVAPYVPSYRPARKHLWIAGLVAMVFFFPWVAVLTVTFSLFVLIGLFLIFGYDGFWRRAMDLGRWYAARNPERAIVLNQKLDAFAMKWDMILDRFPDGTVDGLYMPDFSEMALAEARYDEVLDRRFASLREGGA